MCNIHPKRTHGERSAPNSSRASFITGRYAHRHGVIDLARHGTLNQSNNPSLPKILRAHGFTNLATRRPRVVKEMLRELLRVMGEVGDALPPEASALLRAA